MTEEDPPKEGAETTGFSQLLERVSDPENPRPIRPEEINLEEVKAVLIGAGINLDLSEGGRKSLRHTKFQRFNQGRGPGVIEALGGFGRFYRYGKWAVRVSVGVCPGLRKNPPGLTESRGLCQFLAGVIAFASGAITPEDFTRELNQRAYNGHFWTRRGNEDLKAKLNRNFPGFSRNRGVASVPPGSLPMAWKIILGKEPPSA